MTALPTDSTRTAMTAEKTSARPSYCAKCGEEMGSKGGLLISNKLYHHGCSPYPPSLGDVVLTYQDFTIAANRRAEAAEAELDRLKARVAEMERKLLLTPMAERIAELPHFMAAMSEWGCEDPNERADAITAFLNSAVGLREYLEDQSKAGGRDGH